MTSGLIVGFVASLGATAGAWRSVLLPLLRWVTPAVLVVVLASDLLLNLNPAGWHILSRADGLPVWLQVLVAIALGAALVTATLLVVWCPAMGSFPRARRH